MVLTRSRISSRQSLRHPLSPRTRQGYSHRRRLKTKRQRRLSRRHGRRSCPRRPPKTTHKLQCRQYPRRENHGRQPRTKQSRQGHGLRPRTRWLRQESQISKGRGVLMSHRHLADGNQGHGRPPQRQRNARFYQGRGKSARNHHQRAPRLRSPSCSRRLHSRRTSPPLPQPLRHPRRQSPLEIRTPPLVPRSWRNTLSTSRRPHAR